LVGIDAGLAGIQIPNDIQKTPVIARREATRQSRGIEQNWIELASLRWQ
jgi:hypothetical protein